MYVMKTVFGQRTREHMPVKCYWLVFMVFYCSMCVIIDRAEGEFSLGLDWTEGKKLCNSVG